MLNFTLTPFYKIVRSLEGHCVIVQLLAIHSHCVDPALLFLKVMIRQSHCNAYVDKHLILSWYEYFNTFHHFTFIHTKLHWFVVAIGQSWRAKSSHRVGFAVTHGREFKYLSSYFLGHTRSTPRHPLIKSQTNNYGR